MKLYYMPGACSLTQHILLHELGLPFEIEKVDTKAGKTEKGADFRALNPKGYVPALQLDDGQILTENPAIAQYLADLKPGARLAPPNGSLERVRLQEWLSYITAEVHKGMGALFNKGLTPEQREAAVAALRPKLDYVAGQLSKRPYLLGDAYSAADAYLFVVLSWGKWVGVDLAPWPALGAHAGRVAQRPAVQAALKAEGLA